MLKKREVKTPILSEMMEFALAMRERTQINRNTLERALNRLSIFSSLKEDERVWICSTLIRNGEVDQLLNAVWENSNSIPIQIIGAVYRDIARTRIDPAKDPFIMAEIIRLKSALQQEEWVYSNKSMREENELHLLRLFYLLESLGEEGRDVMFELSLAIYERFNWLPPEIWEKYRGLILTDISRSKIASRYISLVTPINPAKTAAA